MSRGGERLVTTGDDEWYTPADIIADARHVLGNIDLDPASCVQANETIQARHYYTKENDGLIQPWFGRVWMNPPYGRLAKLFTEKFLDSYQMSIIKAGIFLVNVNALGANWGELLWECDRICIPSHPARIHFLNPKGERTSSTHGSLIGYVGKHSERFADTFQKRGTIVMRVRPRKP